MNSNPTSVLLIDDNTVFLDSIARQLRRAGYEVASAPLPRAALEVLKMQTFDMIVCDLRMPDMTGLELQKLAREIHPETAFILATAYGNDENVAEMFREGGVDYLKKPFAFGELLTILKSVEDKIALKRENARLREENTALRHVAGSAPIEMDNLIAVSSSMKTVMNRLQKVAPTETSVLLRGESGTGKEVMARAIHFLSSRRDRVFLSVNCGAIPETLLEAELFGHTKGAFTGAVETRKGFFEAADGGTLFLDEIGEIPLHLQVKLLRVLQESEIQRVGDPTPKKVDVRLVAATNRNLEEGARDGWFRQDLFYRLNVIPIVLPPLRDRREDLDKLIDLFLKKFTKAGKQCRLDDASKRLLSNYPYPGNIRELENAIEHAVVLCEDGQNIRPEDLPLQIQFYEGMEPIDGSSSAILPPNSSVMPHAPVMPVSVTIPPPSRQSLTEIERQAILDAMRRSHFNRTKAAERLGITRRTLGYRIEKHNLEPAIEQLKQQTENS